MSSRERMKFELGISSNSIQLGNFFQDKKRHDSIKGFLFYKVWKEDTKDIFYSYILFMTVMGQLLFTRKENKYP